MLLLAALVRLICAAKFNDTAKPAASSAGVVIFDPEDKRASDLANIVEDCASKLALLWADIFVLITMTNSFRESPCEGLLLGCQRHPLRLVNL